MNKNNLKATQNLRKETIKSKLTNKIKYCFICKMDMK